MKFFKNNLIFTVIRTLCLSLLFVVMHNSVFALSHLEPPYRKATDKPSVEQIMQATQVVIATKFAEGELSDFVRDTTDSIVYVAGNFSGIDRQECLVVCPMYRETGTAGAVRKFVMLFYKEANNNWVKGSFNIIVSELQALDVNNNNLPELVCYTVTSWMGEMQSLTEIYELKDDKETVLYTKESWDSYGLLLEKGAVIEKSYEIQFVDTNKDKILEIEEFYKEGVVSKIKNDDPEYSYKTSKRILKLENGKYN